MIKKETKVLEIKNLKQFSTLTKLRVAVILIFAISTLAIPLAIVSVFVVSVLFILLSYVLVFGLMIKLLIIKKL